MSKSRSKGYIYGTPICIKGDGGSRTIGIPDRLGPTRGAQQRAVPEPRSGEGCTPPAQRAVTFMQQCYHNATTCLSPAPGHRPAKRARRKESRAAAHNLCASMRTTYARACAQPMREHAHNLCVYNAGAPATICRIDISRSVVLDSWIVDEYIFNY
jgi:hypothetical protein